MIDKLTGRIAYAILISAASSAWAKITIQFPGRC